MKNSIIRLILVAFITVIADFAMSQTEQEQKILMEGSEHYSSISCHDSCRMTFRDYTVVTLSHTVFPGESIAVTENKSHKRISVFVEAADSVQYFYGLIGNKLFIDAGTGNLRSMYIYDLQKQRLTDTIQDIVDMAKAENGKLYFSVLMPKKQVESLKLPPCDNPNLELSGYIEYMTYDLSTGIMAPGGNYKCIK